MFDYNKHEEALQEVERIICNVLMIAEGLQYESNLDDKTCKNLALGAFGVIAIVINNACDLISEQNLHYTRSEEWAIADAMRKATPEIRTSVNDLLQIGGESE